MSDGEKVVCVTGASGYIASWLVKLLLHRGYSVRATVRNLCDPSKVGHLKALEGADERLQLFEADLVDDGSFDSVIDGCVGVFHTASPVLLVPVDPKAELLEPAVRGTLNVLRSCSKASSVRRVVITSSIAAVTFNKKPKVHDIVVDETWFSDTVFCEEAKVCSLVWSSVSKFPDIAIVYDPCKPSDLNSIKAHIRFAVVSSCKDLGRASCMEICTRNGIDLVVTNPGLVIGPLLQPNLNFSSQVFLDIIKEKEVFTSYRFVDVRDVVNAHVLAFENPSANGRYVLVGAMLTHSATQQILHKLYPSINVPLVSATEEEPTYQVSKKKAESLGITFTPLEVSIKDTIESLKEKNFLTI